jgi:hypothetical protein
VPNIAVQKLKVSGNDSPRSRFSAAVLDVTDRLRQLLGLPVAPQKTFVVERPFVEGFSYYAVDAVP